jgi:hypothetical protein
MFDVGKNVEIFSIRERVDLRKENPLNTIFNREIILNFEAVMKNWFRWCGHNNLVPLGAVRN